MNPDFWNTVKHYTPPEWRKDPARAHPFLVRAADRIRDAAGVSFYIHVAWDPTGHSGDSLHYIQESGFAEAVDGHFGDGISFSDELLAILSVPEIGGIGFYPEWRPRPGWHFDIRDRVPRLFWVWVREAREYHYGFQALNRAILKTMKQHQQV